MPTPRPSRRAVLRNTAALPFTTLLAYPSNANPAADYRRAAAPRDWAFPRDHGHHDGFKTEWWYFTGHLRAADKRRFGYQLTFFRSALTPETTTRPSPWAATHLLLAHAAISDVRGQSFRHAERLARQRPGYADAAPDRLAVQLRDWSIAPTADPTQCRLRAADADQQFALDLTVTLPASNTTPAGPAKPRLILQGPGGLNPKSAAPGNASYYYSMTRLPTAGSLAVQSDRLDVAGQSWFDHEFASNSLAANQVGWDWLALHLADGRDLMLYRLRNTAGQADYLSGTLVSPAGQPTYLAAADITMAPAGQWTSPASKATYPAGWRVAVKGLPTLAITPLLADQEMQTPNSTDVTYYEGAVDAKDETGRTLGEGYLEMTGYAKPITR